MKSGSDSNEEMCSSNEGGCGPVAIIFSQGNKQGTNDVVSLRVEYVECVESLEQWQEPEKDDK